MNPLSFIDFDYWLDDPFAFLRSNLSEITHALQGYSTHKTLNLYPTLSDGVVYQGTWMGLFYKIFEIYHRSSPMSWHNDCTPAVDNIINTHFHQAIRDVNQLRCRYAAYQVNRLMKAFKPSNGELKDRFKDSLTRESLREDLVKESLEAFEAQVGQEMSFKEFNNMRRLVIRFFSATYQFWSIVVLPRFEQLRQPIAGLLTKEVKYTTDKNLYVSITKLFFCINFDTTLQKEIPLVEITKLLLEEQLTFRETALVTSWVESMNRHQAKIKSSEFQTILKEMAHSITLVMPIADCYEKLLLKLSALHCQKIHKPDPEHLDWRDGLAEGDSISCNGTMYILGPQLSPARNVKDRNKIFALKDYDDCVVKISNNTFNLIVEAQKVKDSKEHWGIYPFETSHGRYDRQGKCVMMKKLHDPLAHYEWTSQSAVLNPEDEKMGQILVSHLIFCQQSETSLIDLSLNHLMFDSRGVLRSLRLIKKSPLDYNELEEFCVQVSKGNPHVLNYLMRASKLYEHKVAKFYRTIVPTCLETGKIDRIHMTGKWESQYICRVEKLCQQAQQMREDTVELVISYLRKEHQRSHTEMDEQTEAIASKIKIELKALYSTSTTSGLLSEGFANIVEAELKKTNSSTPGEFTEALIDGFNQNHYYYEEQYGVILNNNRQALRDRSRGLRLEETDEKKSVFHGS